MSDSLLALPLRASKARFESDFGQRSLLTVDTEEEFDWNGDFNAHQYGLKQFRALAKFQQFAEGIGVSPVYLIDWPIAQSPRAQELLGDAVRRGTAEIGLQLHPWVNPPHDEEVTPYNSFAGNLPAAVEREKFMRLRDAIERNFGCHPQIYRAGRYGLGPNTAKLLKEAGVAIDSSVRARFDYSAVHGVDYSRHPIEPYWVDAERKLLELPLTTVFWGLLRKQGQWLHPRASAYPLVNGILSRLALLEKIALTPEGVTRDEASRGIDIAIDDGLPLLVLSFHSPSLMVGQTPYVRNEDDLDALYDWLRAIYAYLALRSVRPTTVGEIIASVEV